MMKKRIFLLLLIFCLGLGGCGKKEEQTKKKTTATEETGIASKDAMLTLSMILTKAARHALPWRRIGNFRRMAEAFP